MAEMLYHAHSGLRYLVLLVAVIAVLYYAFAFATRRAYDRTADRIGAAFTALLDVQVLVGLVLLFNWHFYGALMGHIVMMVLALVVAHAASVFARRSADARRRYGLRLLGVGVALALVVGGIQAIGRSPFGSQPPAAVQG